MASKYANTATTAYASAAMSVDSLVADMNDVNKEMEANQDVSDKLRKETECFIEV